MKLDEAVDVLNEATATIAKSTLAIEERLREIERKLEILWDNYMGDEE